MQRFWLFLGMVVVISGCAGKRVAAPVEERDTRPPVAQDVLPAQGVTVRAVPPVELRTQPLRSQPLPAVAPSVTTQNSAVLALLSQAQQQSAAGAVYAAQSSLERAQRIAPREPEVYYQLAELQYRQQRHRQAEQLALRGLEVAQGQPQMQRSLWGLVGSARKAMGDEAGYRRAVSRAKNTQ